MVAASKQAYFFLGNDLLLPVFAAAILGGLRNPLGAVAGAVVIAVAETLMTNLDLGAVVGSSSWYLPLGYLPAGSFLMIALCLVWRPEGLFANPVRRV